MKYEKDFTAYFSKTAVFSSKDAGRFLRKAGASDSYIKLFLHNQVKKKKALRIGRGMYTFKDNEAVAGFMFRPFYYGMEYAMTIRRLWTQMANPVVITATSAVPGPRLAMNRKIVVRRISKRMFFGYGYVNYSGMFVPVSETEKILVDFIYYRRKLNGEDIIRLINASDRKKLAGYAKRSGRRVTMALEKILLQYGQVSFLK